MKKMVNCAVCAAAFAAVASDVFVAPHAIGEVAVDSDTVQADSVVVASGGTLRKTGAGTWTLPLDRIAQGWPASIEVAEGGLELQSGTATVFEYAGVSNILAIAADWFDSSKASSIVVDGQGKVTDWLDVRETGSAANGYQLVRAKTSNVYTNLCPELRTSAAYGKTGLYFHGYRSGCWMDFVTPQDASASRWAYHVFAVHGFEEDLGMGCLFGMRQTTASTYPYYYAYCPGNAAGTPYPIWIQYSANIQAAYSGRMYINGRQVDAFNLANSSEGSPKGFSLLESEQLHVPATIGSIFNDRDFVDRAISGMQYNTYAGCRLGGGYVCEMLVFTNKLTAAERVQVESYLMNKWFGAQTPPEVSVATAAGTELKLPEGQGPRVSVTGAGTIRKTCSADETLSLDVGEAGYSGALRLEGGAATIYAAMAQEVSAGETLTVSDEFFGPHFAKSSSAKATEFVKAGNGDVRVTGLASNADKMRIRVDAGELSLMAKTRGCDAVVPDSARVYGTIPNAGFEEGMASTQYRDISNGGSLNGWHADNPNGMVFFWNGTVNVGGGRSTTTWKLPPTAPEGKSALVIKQRAAAWTELTVPEDGVYELSFLCSSRQNYVGLPLRIKIGTGADSLVDLGCCRCMANDWEYYRYRYRTPRLSAGTTYQLWFKAVDDALDRASLIDDVKIVKEDLAVDGEWRIPNGDFSDISGDYAVFSDADQKVFKAANASALVGWTCVQPASSSYLGVHNAITPCTLYMRKDWGGDSSKSYDWWSGRYFNNRYATGSGVQLQLCQGGYATTTFTPPKGNFHLRGKMGLMPMHDKSGNLVNFRATITPQGGEVVDLGIVSRDYSTVMKDDTFPRPFVSDGATPVTLKVWIEMRTQAGRDDAEANVFDYRLVTAESAAGMNLVVNGGFDRDDTWTYSTRQTNPNYKPCRHTHASSSAESWGAALYKGSSYSLRMTADGFATQPINFPLAGAYSLKCAARSRYGFGSPTNWGPDGLRFWYSRGGVTNVIAEFIPHSTNFAERVYNFRVDAAGDYVFGIEGVVPSTATKVDMTSFVDGIVVSPIAYAEDTPGLSAHSRIVVEEGARLRLDFPGTNRVAGVRLGGRLRGDLVTAGTDPDYVSGPGALMVVPDAGMVVNIR